jgi:hypothetical protein
MNNMAYTFNGASDNGSFNVVTSSTGGLGFKKGKNELFPIPSTEININPSLVQNPGW